MIKQPTNVSKAQALAALYLKENAYISRDDLEAEVNADLSEATPDDIDHGVFVAMCEEYKRRDARKLDEQQVERFLHNDLCDRCDGRLKNRLESIANS